MAPRLHPHMVRIDNDAHAKLLEEAARLGISVSRLASMLIVAGCERAEVD